MLEPGDRNITVSQRIASGLKGVTLVIFSAKVFSLIKVLIIDVLLQLRILNDKKDSLAWVMHIFIFVGFIFLLIFHALDRHITVAIYPDYQSTLNPFHVFAKSGRDVRFHRSGAGHYTPGSCFERADQNHRYGCIRHRYSGRDHRVRLFAGKFERSLPRPSLRIWSMEYGRY